MTNEKFFCPLCNHEVSESEYLKLTGRWDKLRQLEVKFRSKLKSEIDKARREERSSRSKEIVLLRGKLASLRGELKKTKDRLELGLTPQIEGLLYEKELARQLLKKFSQDSIISAGKGGDVIQEVRLDGKLVGRIVYECKKVLRLQSCYIEQARRAMVLRKADFAIVVTTAKAKNTFGFWLEKDVLIVHPAGVLALAEWLRLSLIELAKARMPAGARELAAEAVLGFLASAEFRNPLQDAIRRSIRLEEELADERKAHERFWSRRLDHYQTIRGATQGVVARVSALVGTCSAGVDGAAPGRKRITASTAVPAQRMLLQA